MTGIICSCQYFLIKAENQYIFSTITRQQIKNQAAKKWKIDIYFTTRWAFMQQELCSKSRRYHLTGHDPLSLHLSWNTVTVSLWKQTFLPENSRTQIDWMIARADSATDELFMNSSVLGLANSFAASLYTTWFFWLYELKSTKLKLSWVSGWIRKHVFLRLTILFRVLCKTSSSCFLNQRISRYFSSKYLLNKPNKYLLIILFLKPNNQW